MNFAYKFAAVRGMQANRVYYIAMVPLKMLPNLFPNDTEYVPPEFRAQRQLNEGRIPVIRKYITDNRNSYVFSALAASIDGKFEFHSNKEFPDTGVLEISMDSRFLINDVQHRKAAIVSALQEDDSLKDETISVVFYEDIGLSRSQQIFTDLNKHAVKTSNSLSELYDSRDPIAIATRQVISSVDFLEKYTDKEKDNLGKYSSNLFTLNVFYRTNKRILRSRPVNEQAIEFLCQFWKNVASNIEPWNELEKKELSKKELRENYIVTQGVVIQALGVIGDYMYSSDNHSFADLDKLRDIDWKRNASCWRMRVIRADGRIIANDKAVILTSNYIKMVLGFEMSQEEKYKEAEMNY